MIRALLAALAFFVLPGLALAGQPTLLSWGIDRSVQPNIVGVFMGSSFVPMATIDPVALTFTLSTTIPGNSVGNAQLVHVGAATLKGNPGASAGISPQDFTIQGLPAITVSASGDSIPIYNAATGQIGRASPQAIVASVSQSAAPTTGRRQTALTGPMDSNGAPTFLPSSGASLTLPTQNVSLTIPLVLTAANGFNANGGQNDALAIVTALQNFTLADNTTNYLFESISGGVATAGATATAPVYQWGGSCSTSNGQYTFIIQQMTMYVGNGSTCSAAAVVFVGEAVTSGGAVSSTIAYAYQRRAHFSGGSLPAGITPINANLGVTIGVFARLTALNVITQGGYTPGQIIDVYESPGTGILSPVTYVFLRNSIDYVPGASVAFEATNSSGVNFAMTSADWSPIFDAWTNW